jgi:hypothetical protein
MAQRFTGPGSVAAAFGARNMGVMPATASPPQPQNVSPVVAALTGLDPGYVTAVLAKHVAKHAGLLDDHEAQLADHAAQLAALAGDGDDWDGASAHADQLRLPNNDDYRE